MEKETYLNRLRVVLTEKQITNRWLAGQLGKSEMTISLDYKQSTTIA